MNTTLRLSCPEDLIAAAPSLLGFFPQDSVVMIVAGNPSFQARVDLPATDDPDDHVVQVVTLLMQPVVRHERKSAVLLYYCVDKTRASRVHVPLLAALQEADVHVPEALFVTDSHYESFLVPDQAPRPYDVSSHPLLAEAVYGGRSIEAGRAALEEEVAQDSVAAALVQAAMPLVRVDPPNEEAWASSTMTALVEAEGAPDDRTAARLILGLYHANVRDAHWVGHAGPEASAYGRAWASILRRTPTPHQPIVGSLVAMLRFRSGDGARAWCALDVHPDTYKHSLGSLVCEMLANGVAPSEVDQCWSIATTEESA